MPSPKPTWWKDGTCYQIWPASYKDSNNDGLGDIRGIISTLDYLRDLGVDIIWLSPMYDSPQEDMGYDISNYEAVYAPFGTMADMDELIEKVHDRGMRIILDLVINHTSDRHAWFQESKKGRDNAFNDYYMWQSPKVDEKGARHPPNNWRAIWGGSAWEYVPERDQYYLHLFTKEQPDLNWESEIVRKAIYDSAIEFWLKKGVDGFRVDVVNLYSKDPTFPDAKITDPTQELQLPIQHVQNGARMHEFLKEIRRDVLDKYGDVMMVGECALSDREQILRYVSESEKELNMVFDFTMTQLGFEGPDLHNFKQNTLPEVKAAMEKIQHLMKDTTGAWITAFAENHDCPRSISRFATEDPQFRVKAGGLLAIMLSTLTGTLFLYQGQEIGMVNLPESWTIEDYKDVAALNYWKMMNERYPGDKKMLETAMEALRKYGRDNSRTPVQWTDGPNAGFCREGVTPWMRVHDNYKEVNVATARKAPESIFNIWRAALQLRKRKEYADILVHGSFEVVNRDDPNVFTYLKEYDGRKILVMLNFSDQEQEVDILSDLKDRNWELLIANVTKAGETLSPWEARAYFVK